MRFALRMAWREARASRGRFVFAVVAIAVGVGALSGVRGFNQSVHYTLLAEARTLMGADLVVRLTVEPTPDELAFLDSLSQEGIEYTPVTETVSMASSTSQTQPLLSSIKAADLAVYPYYGTLVLDPPIGPPANDEVIVSPDMLLRLSVDVGDTVRIGGGDFRVAAVSLSEPDRMTTGFTLGPRALMTPAGFATAGLDVPGSRATRRLLLRLPEGADLGRLRNEIREVFGRRARVSDFTEENRTLSRGLDRATTFLSLVSLIALIVGGLGVATSIDSHLRQKMDSIAMLKCLGGRSRQVMRIYLLQALLLGLVGSLIGIVIGFGAEMVLPQFLVDYFDVDVEPVIALAPIGQALLAGVLTTLLFTLPPLLSITAIRPALIFRRDMAEEGARPPRRSAWIAFGLIALGLWGMAIWIGDGFEAGSIFAGGLLASVALLVGVGHGLMWAIRRLLDRFGRRMPAGLRYGIGNLYRPGNHMIAVLVALGIGVMFVLAIQLLETALVDQLVASAPPGMPNVYMINITDRERDGLWELVTSQDSVIEAEPLSPAVAGFLYSVNGVPVEQLALEPGERRYLRTQFTLTWSDSPPAATEILDGEWWPAGTAEHLVAVEESAAGILDLKPGDRVAWTVGGDVVEARVANIRRSDGTRSDANNEFILTPGTLDEYPGVYFGAFRVNPTEVGALQKAVFASYPSVTVVNVADIIEIVQDTLGRITLTIRFVAGFAIVGGMIILASSIAGTRYRRIREVAILKSVGARRRRIIGVFSTEFAILGLVAGVIGGVLASAFTALVIVELLDGEYHPDLWPVVAAILLTAALAVATGWLASYRILGQKPLEVLRHADA